MQGLTTVADVSVLKIWRNLEEPRTVDSDMEGQDVKVLEKSKSSGQVSNYSMYPSHFDDR